MMRFRRKNLHAFQFKCLRRILTIIWRAHTGHNTCQKNQWWGVLHVADIKILWLLSGTTITARRKESRSLSPSLVWLNGVWQPHHSVASQLDWPAAACNIHHKYDVIVLVDLLLSFFTLSLPLVMLLSLAFSKCLRALATVRGKDSRSLSPSLVWLNATWQPHHSAVN